MKLKHWIQAARLRTLPLSVSGIILGCSLGHSLFRTTLINEFEIKYKGIVCLSHENVIESGLFWLCILTTISFQVLSNFANDYGDGVKGTDANRKGEKRLVASGEISAPQMKRAMIITGIISLVLSFLTLYTAFGTEQLLNFTIFIILGIASIAAAVKYTVGSNAYGYSGFGDVFVFIFFGLTGTVGSYYLYTQYIEWTIFLPAISVGLLSAAVLNLNNMRDQIEDKDADKNTLVVKLGSQKAKLYHYFLILTSLISACVFVALNYQSTTQFIFLIAFIPLLLNIKVVAQNIIFAELDSELKKVALSTFLFAVLFSIFN